MTPEFQKMRQLVDSLPMDAQVKIRNAADEIRSVVKRHGPAGEIALSYAFIEAHEDHKEKLSEHHNGSGNQQAKDGKPADS